LQLTSPGMERRFEAENSHLLQPPQKLQCASSCHLVRCLLLYQDIDFVFQLTDPSFVIEWSSSYLCIIRGRMDSTPSWTTRQLKLVAQLMPIDVGFPQQPHRIEPAGWQMRKRKYPDRKRNTRADFSNVLADRLSYSISLKQPQRWHSRLTCPGSQNSPGFVLTDHRRPHHHWEWAQDSDC
jgi:hypothetical protein